MNLIKVTSQISDGSMAVVPGVSEYEAMSNKEKFCRQIGIDLGYLARGEQVHGNNVAVVSEKPERKFLSTDALITNIPGIFLSVFTADCVPVFLWDESNQIAGVAHAGWRGVAAGIVPATVQAIVHEYGVTAGNLKAFIGPCIRPCHHIVDEEHCDLSVTVTGQLIANGLSIDNVVDSGECTYCLADKYFSLRRDKSEKFPRGKGNILSIIGWKK